MRGLAAGPANGAALARERGERQAARAMTRGAVTIHFAPAEALYETWPTPTCIIVDGPYGLSGFPGDLATASDLADWYRPHVRAWSKRATAETTLWFWNSELGWATVHPLLLEYGREYRACHVWDKGPGHVAGNANTATLRRLPVVTDVVWEPFGGLCPAAICAWKLGRACHSAEIVPEFYAAATRRLSEAVVDQRLPTHGP